MIQNAYIAYPVAILAGFLTTGMTVALVQGMGQKLFPPPADLDFQDPDALQAFVQQAPVGQLIWVPLAYLLSPIAGTIVAAWILQKTLWLLAVVIGTAFTALSIGMVKKYPGPAWFNCITLLAFPLGALAGYLLAINLFATTG
jgi:hypothetical protein